MVGGDQTETTWLGEKEERKEGEKRIEFYKNKTRREDDERNGMGTERKGETSGEIRRSE
jgi:hypothetical protein